MRASCRRATRLLAKRRLFTHTPSASESDTKTGKPTRSYVEAAPRLTVWCTRAQDCRSGAGSCLSEIALLPASRTPSSLIPAVASCCTSRGVELRRWCQSRDPYVVALTSIAAIACSRTSAVRRAARGLGTSIPFIDAATGSRGAIGFPPSVAGRAAAYLTAMVAKAKQ